MRAYLTSLLRVQPGRGWLAYLTWWTMGHRQQNLQAGRGRHSGGGRDGDDSGYVHTSVSFEHGIGIDRHIHAVLSGRGLLAD